MTSSTKPRGNRIAAALQAGRAQGEQTMRERAGETPPPAVGGNWTKSAVTAMTEKLDEMREMTLQGVLEGTLPIRVPADRIDDPLGTDRIAASMDTESDAEDFRDLVDNIRRRGLRVPLRVRPADPAWRPDHKAPNAIGDMRFVLQSGRRRLAACRELGIDPLVFLSFVEEDDARLEDLQERFFENTVRRNLTSYEKLFSIGLIAAEFPDATQEQIAEIVGVPQASVSRGTAVMRFREELESEINPAAATVAEIDAALSRIRQKHRSETPEAIRQRRARERREAQDRSAALPFRNRTLGGTRLSLRANRDGGRTLTLKTSSLDDQAIERIASLVEELEKTRSPS